jgi:hypothetical protein
MARFGARRWHWSQLVLLFFALIQILNCHDPIDGFLLVSADMNVEYYPRSRFNEHNNSAFQKWKEQILSHW